jgi:hypothetical protein
MVMPRGHSPEFRQFPATANVQAWKFPIGVK